MTHDCASPCVTRIILCQRNVLRRTIVRLYRFSNNIKLDLLKSKSELSKSKLELGTLELKLGTLKYLVFNSEIVKT